MDVAEQEHLTQQLRRRQAYFAQAQRLSSTGSFGWRPSSGEIRWSDETYRIFDVDRTTKPTLELIVQATHPEDRDRLRELIERATREAQDWDVEHRLLMPSGTVNYFHIVPHAAPDATEDRPDYLSSM